MIRIPFETYCVFANEFKLPLCPFHSATLACPEDFVMSLLCSPLCLQIQDACWTGLVWEFIFSLLVPGKVYGLWGTEFRVGRVRREQGQQVPYSQYRCAPVWHDFAGDVHALTLQLLCVTAWNEQVSRRLLPVSRFPPTHLTLWEFPWNLAVGIYPVTLHPTTRTHFGLLRAEGGRY